MEATKDKQEPKKNPITKLKKAIDDKEEQLEILRNLHMAVLWSGPDS